MADNLNNYQTNSIKTKDIGQTIDDIVTVAGSSRKPFERKWYDNNFFDDGYHYRYMSRGQNKVVDLSERATIFAPMRAIPKASRQIRGIANLLVSSDPTPVVYSERVAPNGPDVQEQLKQAKRVAKMRGYWLEKVFKDLSFTQLLAFMAILTQKHHVSWLQVWPDAVREKIRMQVYDAFDVYVMGNLTDAEDSPFMVKATPMLIAEMKANEHFDPDQLRKIQPDNKFANSEIKQAYMQSRFSKSQTSDHAATLLQKEAYLKEYLTGETADTIRKQADGEKILKEKDIGDMVMRQVFVAGNVWLRDRYVSLPHYPLVDFRMEPGPMYGVAQIERFIPQNKSLDLLVSRAERYSHLMVTGSWSQKAGEQYKIDNSAGGQVFQYTSTAPTQNPIAPIPAFFFDLMGMMSGLIDEQGVTTSTLNKLPAGVRGVDAIESLKESEYANLVIASRRLKDTVKKIAERCFDIADEYFISPQEVSYLEKGEPTYFSVIGQSALEGRKKLKVDDKPLDAVPLSRDTNVDIEIENGMAYTREGQKQSVDKLAEKMLLYAKEGLISPDAVKVFIEKQLETYQFGATGEFMEALENDSSNKITEQQILQMKTALLEALNDAEEVGPKASDKRVTESKFGALQALHDAGLITEAPADDPEKIAKVAKTMSEMKQAEEQNRAKVAQIHQDMQLKEEDARLAEEIKRAQATQQLHMNTQLTNAKAQAIKQMPKQTQKGGSNAKQSR